MEKYENVAQTKMPSFTPRHLSSGFEFRLLEFFFTDSTHPGLSF
jgi:hypothetical protein